MIIRLFMIAIHGCVGSLSSTVKLFMLLFVLLLNIVVTKSCIFHALQLLIDLDSVRI